MDHSGWSFICGCAPFSDFAFVARERDDLAEQGTVAVTFYMWDRQLGADPREQWGIFDEVVSWRARDMASIKPSDGHRTTVAVGARGEVFEVDPESGEEFTGSVAAEPILIRCLISLDDVVLGVGMGRTMVIREERDIWREVGPGVGEGDSDRIVGFEGVDGYSMNEIYAAGWDGEIWSYAEGRWDRLTSPTNANLNAVCCASNGKVYVVGDHGTLVSGRGGRWVVLDSGRDENLHDLGEFEGEVFAVTDYRILRLTEQGMQTEDRFREGDRPTTCLHLLRAQDGLLSLGPKDLFRFDGETWERVV